MKGPSRLNGKKKLFDQILTEIMGLKNSGNATYMKFGNNS